jgi:hypothetical protein
MRHPLLSTLVIAVALLGGCGGGDAGLGDSCDRTGDCESALQCMRGVCVDRCHRSPDCGDGYACDGNGLCHLAEGHEGDQCKSEVDCGPGLSCVISGTALDEDDRLRATCTASYDTGPAGAACFRDENCRNGTCALGHCVDLCQQSRDCAGGNSCMVVPRVEAYGSLFGGCLPSGGNITWRIPNTSSAPNFLLPVPSEASYAAVVYETDDQQLVGATRVTAPSGDVLVETCYDDELPTDRLCDDDTDDAQRRQTMFYNNKIRHALAPRMSVLAMPSNPEIELETGVYLVNGRSFRSDGGPGSAIPKVTAVIRIGTGGSLDLHLHFLDLADHPCRAAFKNATLDAEAAKTETFFQQTFLDALRSIFTTKGIAIGSITYDDIADHPDLDSLDMRDAPALLKLGKYDKGINVFFVRGMAPVGLQGFAPAPGPAGLAKTSGSGIVIGADTLCYRNWQQLARLTSHEIARYMGLYHNVEVDNVHGDPILDSGSSSENLMFYSELTNGTELSPGQRDILLRSPVLR